MLIQQIKIYAIYWHIKNPDNYLCLQKLTQAPLIYLKTRSKEESQKFPGLNESKILLLGNFGGIPRD